MTYDEQNFLNEKIESLVGLHWAMQLVAHQFSGLRGTRNEDAYHSWLALLDSMKKSLDEAARYMDAAPDKRS